MSKYDGLDENECRQLLRAKLKMLVRWANGRDPMGRFDDLETSQYHEALHDAEDLVKLLNRSYRETRNDVNKALHGQFTEKEIAGFSGFAPAFKG